MFQHWEIIAIVLVALLLFGSRLPNIARSFGKSISEFKKGVKDVKDDLDDANPKNLEDKSPSRELPAETVQSKESSDEKTEEKVS